METGQKLEEAVVVLQQLGLKEYEARCFVGLSRVRVGTAKQLSEMTDVPRTRVYDAIRMLEAQGLVEVRHSSPQQFRAVPLEEAIELLRDQYEARVERLQGAMDSVELVDEADESSVRQVWTMTGRDAVENRTADLVRGATDEIVLVVGDESVVTEELIDALTDVGTGVDLLVGAVTASLRDRIHTAVPAATTFVFEMDGETAAASDAAIGRVLLVDRSAFLVSSMTPETKEEQAIVGEGFDNGLTAIARRFLTQRMATVPDPIP